MTEESIQLKKYTAVRTASAKNGLRTEAQATSINNRFRLTLCKKKKKKQQTKQTTKLLR